MIQKTCTVVLFCMLLCNCLTLLQSSNAEEASEIMWSKTFGETLDDEGYSVQQTIDGGYIITGKTYFLGLGFGNFDVWLIKTDASGNIEWDKTFGGDDGDQGYSVQQTADEGYILTGSTQSYGAGYEDVWLIKTDLNGIMIWSRTFGGIEWDIGNSVQQTTDGGYILTGSTASYGNGLSAVWLIKTNSNGTEEWNKTFGGTESDHGNSAQQTYDNGYIITGLTESFGSGSGDVWLIKTNSNGTEEWNKTFGGTDYDWANSVQQTKDEGYIITGCTESYGAKNGAVWLIKTDSNCNKEWDRTFGGTHVLLSDQGFSVQQTADGGYIITGSSSKDLTTNVWLIKTDSMGNSSDIDYEIKYNNNKGTPGFELIFTICSIALFLFWKRKR